MNGIAQQHLGVGFNKTFLVRAQGDDMTLGILPAAIQYNALHDRSLLDDICWSDMVAKSGVLDRRLPLVSTYSAKQSESQLPPQAAHDINPGGRPESEGVTSDGQENDVDSYYLRVELQDGRFGWTSPIWVEKN